MPQLAADLTLGVFLDRGIQIVDHIAACLLDRRIQRIRVQRIR
jgi:hypothetical protein